MPVPEAPWWKLNPTPLVFGEPGAVFLKDTESLSPVLEVKVVTQAVPGQQGPRASGKGAWSISLSLQKNNIKDLRNVSCLTDRQRVPVYLCLHPIYTPYVCRHQSRGKLYSSVQAGDPSSQPLSVRRPYACAFLSQHLLQHPGPECAWMAFHDLRLRDIRYQSVPE